MVAPDPRSPTPLTRERLLRQADALEPLPATATRLVTLLSQSEWMIRDVEEVVRLDLGLTARVLRFANSAWTAHLPSVSTVRDALMRIGVGTALSLAIAEGVRPRLLKPLPAFDLQPGRLWQHAVAAALATEIVTRRARTPIPPETVTASLLHDVGKVVLDEAMDEATLTALRTAWTSGSLSRIEAERQVLGMDHGELGGYVARHWGLPERVAAAITHHHTPAAARSTICDVVHLSNGVAKLSGFGPLIAEIDGPIEGDVLARLNFSPTDLHTFCSELTDRMRTGQERFH
ncbi:HD family phosphohydrolase [Luteitalea sp. TBR-22]|uniref:HDOD domain-containing protein n=1 Tax=Luteitalea sp. TBR-22 TaxID=2802971 RepID=UPI001AFB50A9|nr:HDOD domain-containing protein [Luteitalea sp. TBR-22]BCS33011.1 HD family phosphohydrolase [Luteitalea sp. TBR-22]